MVERPGKQEVQSERKIYKRMYEAQQQFFMLFLVVCSNLQINMTLLFISLVLLCI